MVKNIFKYAAKHGLRFPYKGQASVEDLFNLGLNELDAVYKLVKKQQKNDSEESLISDKTRRTHRLKSSWQLSKRFSMIRKPLWNVQKLHLKRKHRHRKFLKSCPESRTMHFKTCLWKNYRHSLQVFQTML